MSIKGILLCGGTGSRLWPLFWSDAGTFSSLFRASEFIRNSIIKGNDTK